MIVNSTASRLSKRKRVLELMSYRVLNCGISNDISKYQTLLLATIYKYIHIGRPKSRYTTTDTYWLIFDNLNPGAVACSSQNHFLSIMQLQISSLKVPKIPLPPCKTMQSLHHLFQAAIRLLNCFNSSL